ncbi:MAG: metallophosphoesterase [Myxococcota bacterium]|nr:metallophosphoesterase [Myxococcota bacterium]
MTPPAPSLAIAALAGAVALGVPLFAGRARGRRYGIFAAVVLGISLPGCVALHARLAAAAGTGPDAVAVSALFAWGVAAAGLHLASLVRARLRPAPFRWGLSVPGMATLALGALAGPLLLLLWPLRAGAPARELEGAGAALARLDAVPVLVVAASLVTSLRPRREHVRIRLDGEAHASLARLPVERSRRPLPAAPERPLRLVQIADPHLGPWQPEARLARQVEELLAAAPDLVLLTGDFLTMEGSGTPGALARALRPLRAARGRCFAVFGNHDHEAPEEVRSALAESGVRLLVDDEAMADTAAGPVQIVGADWVRRNRGAHLAGLLARFPRRPGALRLLLLHDPLGFRALPPGEVDLVLSGHTHGGQVGLLSLGVDWTVLRRSRWPDHGLFGRGRSRLYVHRGTGFYGFPLRVGVPGEHSVMDVLLPEPS